MFALQLARVYDYSRAPDTECYYIFQSFVGDPYRKANNMSDILHQYAMQVASALIQEEYERKLYTELVSRFRQATSIEDPAVEAALETAIENDFNRELQVKREVVAAIVEALIGADSLKLFADFFKSDMGQVLLKIATAAQVALDEYDECEAEARIERLHAIFSKSVENLHSQGKN
jgi:hypothetical protein